MKELFKDVYKDTEEELVELTNKYNINEFLDYRKKIDQASKKVIYNRIYYGITPVTDLNICSLYKNYLIKSMHRYTTDYIKDAGFNIISEHNLDDAVWCNIHKTYKRSYFIVCLPTEGKIFKSILRRNNKNIELGDLHHYGTTQPDYKNVTLHYSHFIYDSPDVGVTEHQLMAGCCGLMDKSTLLELATYTVNHRNRDHYDNRLNNLDFDTVYNNNLHKIVTNELLKLGLFHSMSTKAAITYRNLDKDTKIKYIQALEKLKKSDIKDCINDIVLYQVIN